MYKRGVANRVSDNNIIANWTAHHKISQWQNLRCDEKVQWHQICGLIFNLENLINCIVYFLFKGGHFCLNLRVYTCVAFECSVSRTSFPHCTCLSHLVDVTINSLYVLAITEDIPLWMGPSYLILLRQSKDHEFPWTKSLCRWDCFESTCFQDC